MTRPLSMRRKVQLATALLALAAAAVSGQSTVKAQSQAPAAGTQSANSYVASNASESKDQRDARMKWWREARFGMFIHWGVYSVPAGVYDGATSPASASGS